MGKKVTFFSIIDLTSLSHSNFLLSAKSGREGNFIARFDM